MMRGGFKQVRRVGQGRFLECLRLRPIHDVFSQEHIKSMYLFGLLQDSTMIELLKCCRGVTCLSLEFDTNVFVRDASPLWHALDGLQLHSLMLHMEINLPDSISTLSVFQNLTHLDAGTQLTGPHAGRVALASLMHLCLGFCASSCDPTALICLIGNARLRLIGLRVSESHCNVERFLCRYQIVDQRLVLLPMQDPCWIGLGKHETSMWTLAEAKVSLPTAKTRRHRCVSITAMYNAYANYDNEDQESDDEDSCVETCKWAEAQLKHEAEIKTYQAWIDELQATVERQKAMLGIINDDINHIQAQTDGERRELESFIERRILDTKYSLEELDIVKDRISDLLVNALIIRVPFRTCVAHVDRIHIYYVHGGHSDCSLTAPVMDTTNNTTQPFALEHVPHTARMLCFFNTYEGALSRNGYTNGAEDFVEVATTSPWHYCMECPPANEVDNRKCYAVRNASNTGS
ncbi:hypothetical protein BDR03DRAFT_986550 [Suillus americanus]|nr:hypothetical protein BDR03DRAFT_986550 [Suillus americanus]